MKTTRRGILRSAAASGLTILGGAGVGRGASQAGGKKRVLAIVGDAYHAAAPLDSLLVGGLKKAGWEAVTIIDYAVPWDEFASFDLIIMSREGREYVQYLRERDTHPSEGPRQSWATPVQEDKFEDYVNAGGRLFLYHDGFGNYEKGRGVSRVARSYFIRHPAIVPINVSPTAKMPEITEGVTSFTVADEEYQVEMDESQTSVFMESHSPQHGRAPQGWAHSYGKGKVAVFIPGHNRETQRHPMVRRTIQNCLTWLTK
jgi:trehalose utilization protein